MTNRGDTGSAWPYRIPKDMGCWRFERKPFAARDDTTTLWRHRRCSLQRSSAPTSHQSPDAKLITDLAAVQVVPAINPEAPSGACAEDDTVHR